MRSEGKTVIFLGSSVTYGSASGGISFADLMAQNYGICCIKEAVSGTTLADTGKDSYVSRLKKLDRSIPADLFICQLSTNDAVPERNISISQVEDAIRFIVRYVKEAFHCPVVFFTGTYFENERYADMIRLLYSLQKDEAFHILDLYHDPDMLAVSEEDYRIYMDDPIHPTLEGYAKWWLPKFADFCEQFL